MEADDSKALTLVAQLDCQQEGELSSLTDSSDSFMH